MTTTTDAPPPALVVDTRTPSRLRLALLVLLASVIVVAAVWAGFALRRYVWDVSEPIRYVPDMVNAYQWGTRANEVGFVDLYDRVVAEHPDGNYGLDYVPLRLLTMTLWTNWTAEAFPGVTQWRNTYAFNRPLLLLNGVMELLGAVAAGLLTHLWVRRGGADQTKAIALGLAAGLLLWFNPAMVFSGHARPTWDVWIVPFYLLAMWLACTDRWLLAGTTIAIGACFKGQQLAIAPVFILWPLLMGRWRPVLRWVAGFATALAVVLSPWMLSRFDAAQPLHRVPDWMAIGAVLACGAVVMVLGIVLARHPQMLRRIFGFGKTHDVRAVGVNPRSARGFTPTARTVVTFGLATMSLLTLSSLWLFHGSTSWYEVAIRYGADKFTGLEAGGTASVAGILAITYRLQPDDVAVSIGSYNVTWKAALGAIHIAMLLLATVAMARADRRGSRAFLIAMAAPWVTMFAFAPGMHERYLLWGAAFLATGVALGTGPLLLYVALTGFSWVQQMCQILGNGRPDEFLADAWPGFGTTLLAICRGMIPGLGWAIAVAAVTVLYLAFSLCRRKSPLAASQTSELGFHVSRSAKPQAAQTVLIGDNVVVGPRVEIGSESV